MPPTTGASPLRPLPLPDDLTEGFWAGVTAHRLQIQRCVACRGWTHAPALTCQFCGGGDLRFEPVSGRGTLHSWTVLHDPPGPGFKDLLPLIVGVVELDEQPRLFLVSNLVNVAPGELRLGLPLKVTYEQVTPERVLPLFEPAA